MNCPCTENKPYSECCEPFHKGENPKNALQLMRSRYSAYVLKKVEYILKTTHPHNPQKEEKGTELFIKRANVFCETTQFKGLEILDFHEKDHQATVTFVAYMFQNGQEITFTERSSFLRKEGIWLYFGGEMKWGKASLCDFPLKKEPK